MNILTWILIIVIGIPFAVAVIIPMLVYLGQKTKRIPNFDFLLRYFNVDISQPPYCDWMERSPILFLSLTSIELYVSYYLIKLIGVFKWIGKGIWRIGKGIGNLIMRYMRWQWKKWDEMHEAEEKKYEKGLGIKTKQEHKKVWIEGHYETIEGKKYWIAGHYEKIPIKRR